MKNYRKDNDIPQLLPKIILYVITIALLIIAILGVYFFTKFKSYYHF